MPFTEEQQKELQLFVSKWKSSIHDSDTYFSFNGHGHLRYVNANDAGLVKFGVKFIEAALSNENHINIVGEGISEDWIRSEDEELSIHYIEKINENISLFIEDRKVNKEAVVKKGKLIGPLLIAVLLAIPVFFIYLFIFWLRH